MLEYSKIFRAKGKHKHGITSFISVVRRKGGKKRNEENEICN